MRADPVIRPLATRLLALAVAVSLSLGTGPAQADPSERDLAYELGVQAETSGDLTRAAAAFERAYRLTAPAETGPRLLFLRASVAARLRAADDSPLARIQLCQAQALLRDYLDEHATLAAPRTIADANADERASLEQIDLRLGASEGPTCATLLSPTPADPPPPVVVPPASQPGPQPEPAPPPRIQRPTPPTQRPPATLQIVGGVSLGVGAVGLAVLIGGVVLGRRANQRGHAACREASTGCSAFDSELRDIEADGRRGDTLVAVGAVFGGLGVLAGAVLLAVGERRRKARRVTWTPTLGPGRASLGLSGRF